MGKCYYPLKGYRARTRNESGKRSIVFNPAYGYADQVVTVPCGRCIGCRLEYSRQWAVRCMHEASMHEENSFVTLTFAPEYLPTDNSIRKEHLQKFFKRLRKNTGAKMRYFACGEYGEKKSRPHYHAILFGYGFPDKQLYTVRQGNRLYRSAILERAWPFGHSLIGEVTFQSCAYVARYVMKKWKKDSRDDETEINMANAVVDRETGEIIEIQPEFCLMSRRPGIGRTWLEKYKTDTDKDFVTVNKHWQKLPKYYDQVLEVENELDMMKRKGKRKRMIKEEENTIERLKVQEKVKEAQIGMLHRPIEGD